MERRDFLKYMMALGACGCCACNYSKEENEKTAKNDWLIDHIGIPICYHCNLNCAYCNHYSPVSPKCEIPFEQFERDIKQLHRLTKGKVREIVLMGGEPLLHKDINKFMRFLNKYFPETKKRITTNGILLKKMDEEFWNTCRENNISIKCTLYSLYKDCPTLEEVDKLKELHQVKVYSSRSSKVTFLKTGLVQEPLENSEGNCKNCFMNVNCAQLDNGVLYPCCVMSNIRFFNNHFKDYAIPLVESDYLDIHKISSVEEIKKYFSFDKEFCKHCNYGRESAPWRLSQHELSEWYGVKGNC